MYKLLIVDDEPLVQVGIKSMLPWSSINIEIAGIASNGQAALSIIEDTMPDIVITDIKMPIMSGLELAKVCRERYEDNSPAFIILTSYEDFSLAREALACQVSDYLVKIDLTPDTLRESVEKIIQRLERDTKKTSSVADSFSMTYYYDKFFISLLHNLFEDRTQFDLHRKELQLKFDSTGYICCYCEIIANTSGELTDERQLNLFHTAFQMSKELFAKYRTCHAVTLDLRHFAIIFCYTEENPQILAEIHSILNAVNTTLHNYYNVSLHSGIGTLVNDPLAIAESYQYSRDAFSNTDSSRPVVFFDDCIKQDSYKKSFNFSIFKDALARAYEEYDAALLSDTLTEIITLFKQYPGNFLQAMDCASNILYLSISLLQNGEDTVSALFADSADNYRTLYKMTTTEQIIGWLTYFRDSLCTHFNEHRKEVRKPVVSQVRNYVKEHVTEHLSLNEVAAVFGISPNYLSQLFKKYNDIGYNDFVTQCKIDEARKLLGNGDYKVYEVAEMLGFESAFYFSKVFKKVVGIPPTEYMQK